MMKRASDREIPGSSTVWKLWYRDLFDRETPPSLEATGTDILEGLYTLWLHTLREGILDDGSASFSRFHLAWGEHETGHTDAGVEPFDNHTLLKLRQWAGLASAEQEDMATSEKNKVVWRIAELHYELLQKRNRGTGETLYWSREARALLKHVDAITDPGKL